MRNKTVVETLIDSWSSYNLSDGKYDFNKLLHDAILLEKEQIMNAYMAGFEKAASPKDCVPEEYYRSTYAD